MKVRAGFSTVLAAALLLFTVQGRAQQQAHHPEGKQQESMPPTGGMMTQHEQIRKLVGQLMQSLGEIRGEKNPQKLERKLAEHGAVLEQFGAAMKKQSAAMSDHMKNCPMMKSGMMNSGPQQEKE